MKAVISDTSPISYLVRIGEIGVLPAIFGEVLIPPAVLKELRHPKAFSELRHWAQHLPEWIRECPPQHLLPDLDLDPGETEAISLAKEHAGALLIIDEMKGRSVATHHDILITGTLGLLEEADRRGLLDFEIAVEKLRTTNFRMNAKMVQQMLERARARKSKNTGR